MLLGRSSHQLIADSNSFRNLVEDLFATHTPEWIDCAGGGHKWLLDTIPMGSRSTGLDVVPAESRMSLGLGSHCCADLTSTELVV